MHHGTTVHPKHAATLDRMREAYAEFRGGDAVPYRAAEIAALPMKDWRGRPVFQLRCHGTTGKGPHDVWVPEYLLWSLVALQSYLCPYHRR